MSDNLVENDLDTFSAEFFNTKTPEAKEEVKAEEPDVTDDVEDTDENIDDDTVAAEVEEDAEVDEDDDSPDGEEEDSKPEPKKNRKTAKERIQELNTKLRETERAAAAERAETTRRLAELEAKLVPKEDIKKEGKLPSGAPDPNADDADGEAVYPLGEFDPAYIRDLTRFTIKTEQEAAEVYRREAEQKATVEAARNQVQNIWAENLAEAEKELPDVREKIGSLGDMFTDLDAGYGQYLVDVVMTLKTGPHILAYLADNPKEAREIVNSGPASATLSLGRLDAKLAQAKNKEETPKKVSKAPEPPTKTTRGTGGSSRVAGDTDDLDAFAKALFRRK